MLTERPSALGLRCLRVTPISDITWRKKMPVPLVLANGRFPSSRSCCPLSCAGEQESPWHCTGNFENFHRDEWGLLAIRPGVLCISSRVFSMGRVGAVFDTSNQPPAAGGSSQVTTLTCPKPPGNGCGNPCDAQHPCQIKRKVIYEVKPNTITSIHHYDGFKCRIIHSRIAFFHLECISQVSITCGWSRTVPLDEGRALLGPGSAMLNTNIDFVKFKYPGVFHYIDYYFAE